MHKQAIKHKQAIIGGGYLFTENACYELLSAEMASSDATLKSLSNRYVLFYFVQYF